VALVLRFDPLTELVMQLKIEERHFYEDPAELEILILSVS
jgi:hypothetical protein